MESSEIWAYLMENPKSWFYLYFCVFGASGMVVCLISLIRGLLSDVRKKKKEGE